MDVNRLSETLSPFELVRLGKASTAIESKVEAFFNSTEGLQAIAIQRGLPEKTFDQLRYTDFVRAESIQTWCTSPEKCDQQEISSLPRSAWLLAQKLGEESLQSIDFDATAHLAQIALQFCGQHAVRCLNNLWPAATPLDQSHPTNGLHIATTANRLDVVGALLAKGVDPSARDTRGQTPLEQACSLSLKPIAKTLSDAQANPDTPAQLYSLGDTGSWVVKLLAEAGAALNRPDLQGRTPLVCALRNGQPEVAKALLENGVDPTAGTPIRHAIDSDRIDLLQVFKEAGADLQVRNGKAQTLLHLAAEKGSINAIEWLVSEGIGVSVTDANGETPLFAASYCGENAAVRAIIAKGAKVDHRNNEGWIALHSAAAAGCVNTLELLLELGANLRSKTEEGETALHLAAQCGESDMVAHLASRGLSIFENSTDGESPLFAAARLGKAAVITKLVELGAKVNKKNRERDTPLIIATSNCRVSAILALIDAGANPNALNSQGLAPLHLATSKGLRRTAQILVEKGAKVGQLSKIGKTPLHMAIEHGYTGLIEILKATVNRRSKEGETPLFFAVRCKAIPCITELVRLGANPHAQDTTSNMTAITCAAYNGLDTVVEALLAVGAPLDALDQEGETALHAAASQGHFSTVQLLIRKGADQTLTNHKGKTPLELAEEGAHEEVVNLLSAKRQHTESTCP